MTAPRDTARILMLAAAAAVFAACGGEDRARKEADLAAAPPASEIAEGAWFYKESNGYPWAGYGPPRSEAFFVVSCEGGRTVFQRAGGRGPSEGAETFRIRTAEGAGEIVMEDAGTELPMLSGVREPDAEIARLMLETLAPFAV